MKTFYRVNNKLTGQGLWYDWNGNFTGFIHDRFKFCSNAALAMEFDPEIVGWLSATETLEDLWAWFTKDDIAKLETEGWCIHEYKVPADSFRWYDRFSHWLIDKSKVKPVRSIPLKDLA